MRSQTYSSDVPDGTFPPTSIASPHPCCDVPGTAAR
ncbi:Uncharacterised protein [Mycobacteroides abscessus]|nr:Uncharacterised protein [Mycobacteroides abscessus]